MWVLPLLNKIAGFFVAIVSRREFWLLLLIILLVCGGWYAGSEHQKRIHEELKLKQVAEEIETHNEITETIIKEKIKYVEKIKYKDKIIYEALTEIIESDCDASPLNLMLNETIAEINKL